MRRWLVLLMVVLLPLRGWAGDLMSVQMATAAAAAQAVAAMPAAMPADCPMHTGDAMPSCSSCELCIPMARLACGSLDAVSFAQHEQPLMRPVAFMSASLAPAVEPPIS